MKKIAASLDGSELSQAALPWVQCLAQSDTEFHLIRAFAQPHQYPQESLGPVPDESKTKEVIEKIKEYLETQASKLDGPVKMHAGCGEPAETILYQAEKREVDLLVMAQSRKRRYGTLAAGQCSHQSAAR